MMHGSIPTAAFSIVAAATLALLAVDVHPASPRTQATLEPVFVDQLPAGYRDWFFVSVAREEGVLDDIRGILGNGATIQSYREHKSRFLDGAMIARLAYSYDSSDENNKAFGRRQSFVAGHPKNGVQLMVKDSKKYVATGGWGYGQFDGGKLAEKAKLETCFPCHQAVAARDFVFTRYSP
jgi:hypothetical protein